MAALAVAISVAAHAAAIVAMDEAARGMRGLEATPDASPTSAGGERIIDAPALLSISAPSLEDAPFVHRAAPGSTRSETPAQRAAVRAVSPRRVPVSPADTAPTPSAIAARSGLGEGPTAPFASAATPAASGHEGAPGPSGGVSAGTPAPPNAAAPAPAPAADPAAMRAYMQAVGARIQAAMRYPEQAERDGVEGTVLLRLVILPDGALRAATIDGGDADALLRAAALDAARRAGPLPVPPAAMAAFGPLALRVPLRFSLRAVAP